MADAIAEAAPVLMPAVVESADPRDLLVAVAQASQGEIAGMDRGEAEAFALACDRARAALDARQSLAMDTLASRVDEDLQRRAQERRDEADVAHPGPELHGFVASMLAPALHCATRTVRARLEADRWLVCAAEASFQALWDGHLDRPRADAVVQAARSLEPSLWARFEALVLETTVDPVTGEVSLVSAEVQRLNRSQLARRAARIARALDPAGHHRATRQARDQRRVVVQPDRHRPGLALWKAHLPSEVSDRVFAAVDTLASRYATANPGTGLDAHRADALADLVLGNTEVKTVVELVVPVLPAHSPDGPAPGPLGALQPVTATLTGSDEPDDADRSVGAVSWIIPGVIDDPRHGVLLPDAIRDLLSNPDTVVRLARLDPDGSIVQDPTAYRPSASTRRRVRARDGHCRFPGCHTPAARTDTDHVTPHPHGPTEHTNLISLCRTHHLFKHHAGWRPTLAADGTVTWTAPDGRAWTTHPRPHDLRAELTPLEHLDPETAHHLRRGWYPGLPPGMSLADLTRAEHTLPDDPPEPDHTPPAPPDWQHLDQHLPGRAPEPPEPVRDQRPRSASPSALEQRYEHLLTLAA